MDASEWSKVKRFTTQCDMPNAPSANDADRCGNGTLNLSASGSGVIN